MNSINDTFSRLLRYDENSGVLRWKVSRGNHVSAGDIAGFKSGPKDRNGRRRLQIEIESGSFKVTYVIWCLKTGAPPPSGKTVDHKNGIPDDNRWRNLRLATRQEQGRNRGVRSDSRTGIRGVCLHRCGKYLARIHTGEKRISLGYFFDLESAVRARKEAEQLYFGDFNRAVGS